MTVPDRSVIASIHGYHPLVSDEAEALGMRVFFDMLVLDGMP